MLTPVLTIGETMVLVAPATPTALESARDFRLDIAGAESNVASHLARCGVPAAWAGAVGADPLGRRLVATLAGRGVDTSLVRVDPHAPTGVIFKDPAADGTAVHYYRRGSAASRLGPWFAANLPLADAPVVHVSGITAALSSSCRALLDEVIAVRDGRVSFDVNYRPALWDPATAARELRALADRCELVFVGRDEAAALWGTVTADDVRDLLGADTLIVKDGAVGAHAFVGGAAYFAPTPPAEVVEPVGAGDAFAAGYLAAELAGAPPAEALACGHRRAATVLATTGDF